MKAHPRRLVVLDLNGTLLHRLMKAHEVSAAKAHPSFSAVDTVVNGNPIVFRPHLASFLRSILARADVAVWTSALPKNAVPMVARVFDGLLDWAHPSLDTLLLPPGLKPSGTHRLGFLWTQHECATLKTAGPRPEFRKDLGKIWEAYAGVYGAANTIMVDDTASKLERCRENLLEIGSFDVTVHDHDYSKDCELRALTEYLETSVFASDEVDVREIMKQTRFQSTLSLRSVAELEGAFSQLCA